MLCSTDYLDLNGVDVFKQLLGVEALLRKQSKRVEVALVISSLSCPLLGELRQLSNLVIGQIQR
jgi:hypothetical protein